MTIQPLLLTALTGRPGMAPVFAVHRTRASDAAKRSTERQDGDRQGAHRASRRLLEPDTLEISAEAQALEQLSDEQRRVVERLKAQDRGVRAHEQAHLAAAGPYATGGPHYNYTTGPDRRQYAVGGEVGIDTAPVEGDPEATVRKAQVVRAAALAPADPSPQDHRVAARASQMEAEAQGELRQQEQAEREQDPDQDPQAAASVGTLFDAFA